MAGQPLIIPSDLVVNGNASFKTITIPAGAVGSSQIAAGTPGDFISPTTARQRLNKTYKAPSATAVASNTEPLHLVIGAAATAISFQAALITACVGAATVTVDLKINGTSILTTPLSFSSTNTARQVLSAIFATTALTVGQIVEVVVTATASTGTLGSGIIATLQIDEDPF